MTWMDRIREAAYTSPSGTRIVFDYEDVRQAVTKKTTAFEFPDAEGTYVQDLGVGGRRYPLRVFFWGANYDQVADAFGAALDEQGVGKLEHPIYGAHDVIPFGEIVRRDDLKTAANQAVFEVTFWETSGLIYPTAQGDPGSDVLDAVSGFNVAASETFAATPGIQGAVARASLKGQYERNLAAVSAALAPIAATQDDVAARFATIEDSIALGIDVLVADPLTLGFQTALLIQTPALALASISDRLSAYGSLLASIVTRGAAGGVAEFRTDDLFASTLVSAMVVSTVNTTFLTKTGAIAAAEILLQQLEALTVWRDDYATATEVVDSGGEYQRLQEAVTVAAGFLVELSFTLKRERVIILSRPRQIIPLAAELYGDVDDATVNFLISSNALTGSEILEIPRGRRIVYYI